MLGQALAHLSRSACHRTIKLSDPSFTGLSRFLSPNEGVVQAFQTIQKPFTALDAEIRHLINPVSTDYYSIAGEIEDHATNAPYVVQKTAKIIDNLYYILGIEALHAAQAVDLRKVSALGKGSKVLYESLRDAVPFLEQDRPLSFDIQKAYEVLTTPALVETLRNSAGTLMPENW
jgi:histidine ammonia-lyase